MLTCQDTKAEMHRHLVKELYDKIKLLRQNCSVARRICTSYTLCNAVVPFNTEFLVRLKET